MNRSASAVLHVQDNDIDFDRIAASIADDIDGNDTVSDDSGSASGSARSVSQQDHVIHEYLWQGPLRKRSDWLPHWESCYGVLQGVTLTIYDSKAKRVKEMFKFSVASVKKEEGGKGHCFIITTALGQIVRFSVESQIERTIWFQMLNAAIAHSKKRASPLNSKEVKRMRVNLGRFYESFGCLLMRMGDFSTVIPYLNSSISITTNYPSTVPINGEYHGYDGFVDFFVSIYRHIGVSAFRIAQIVREKDLAVIQGRETLRNMSNNRRFRQTWIHELRFASDGKISHINIKGDPIVAAVAFGATADGATLSLPHAVEESTKTCPPGVIHVACVRAEAVREVQLIGRMSPYVKVSLKSFSFSHSRSLKKSRGKCVDENAKQTAKARCSCGTVVWTENISIPFAGAVPGTPTFLYLEVWNSSIVGDELIGAAKINLAPFLVWSAGDTEDQALGAVPNWYSLFRPDQFSAANGSNADSNRRLSSHGFVGGFGTGLTASLSARESKSCKGDGKGSFRDHDNMTPDAATSGRIQVGISFTAEAIDLNLGDSDELEYGKKSDELRSRGSFDRLENLHKLMTSSPRDDADDEQDPSGSSTSSMQIHSFSVAGTIFKIPCRYQLIKPIGHGAYGVVIAASDQELGTSVAIKNIPRTFDDLVDAKRIVREIRLMRHLSHPNILAVRDVMRPPSLLRFEDTYIVTDLMETDLHRVISSKQELSQDHICYITYQILCALQYMHSANVIHRDMKPSNILVNSDCTVKICDFGLARGVDSVAAGLTEYVVTRWYRAPELLLSSQYESKIDIWSVGCILAEMFMRKALFPGHDHVHQLQLIAELLGSPSEDELGFITNAKAKRWILRQTVQMGISLEDKFPKASDDGIDLLRKLLKFDPKQRITVSAALNHRYFDQYRDPQFETFAPTPFNFDFERVELDKPALQRLIFNEVCHFHPEAREELEAHIE